MANDWINKVRIFEPNTKFTGQSCKNIIDLSFYRPPYRPPHKIQTHVTI